MTKQTVATLLEERLGRVPEVVVRAPGRINLIGEHVDYAGGIVLPLAIEREVWVAAARNGSSEVRLWSEGGGFGGEVVRFDLRALHARSGKEAWVNYGMGVCAGYEQRGARLEGFDAVIASSVPAGAGLSSSAALETAIALVVEQFTGVPLSVVERALLCQRAEHQFAGVPCGIMDQLAVGASREGHALRIDCQDLAVKEVRMPPGLSLVVAATGVKHALVDGAYRQRREDCAEAARQLGVASLREVSLERLESLRGTLGERLFRRARHVVSEIARVEAFEAALEGMDLEAIGALMRQGHTSLRDDFEVSCVELDVLVEAAYGLGRERGLVGARMTGGGFGGSTVNVVFSDAVPECVEALERAYRERFGKVPRVFVTGAAEGAQVVWSSAP